MILIIDGLEIPKTVHSYAEPFNADVRWRTVSMRLITKSSMAEKWRVTLGFGGNVLRPQMRSALYERLTKMRKTPAPVSFISPEDGITRHVSMKCIQRLTPRLAHKAFPDLYLNCGAVLEEV